MGLSVWDTALSRSSRAQVCSSVDLFMFTTGLLTTGSVKIQNEHKIQDISARLVLKSSALMFVLKKKNTLTNFTSLLSVLLGVRKVLDQIQNISVHQSPDKYVRQ